MVRTITNLCILALTRVTFLLSSFLPLFHSSFFIFLSSFSFMSFVLRPFAKRAHLDRVPLPVQRRLVEVTAWPWPAQHTPRVSPCRPSLPCSAPLCAHAVNYFSMSCTKIIFSLFLHGLVSTCGPHGACRGTRSRAWCRRAPYCVWLQLRGVGDGDMAADVVKNFIRTVGRAKIKKFAEGDGRRT